MEAVNPITPRSFQLADEYQLGTPLAEYRDATSESWKNILLLLILVIVFIFIYIWVSHLPFSSVSHDIFSWIADATFKMMEIMLLCMSGMIMVGFIVSLVGFIRKYMRGGKHITLYSRGVTIVNGRTIESARWEDAPIIFRNVAHHGFSTKTKASSTFDSLPRTYYTLRLTNGKNHSLSEELGSLLEQQLITHNLPQALDAFQSGKLLDFGVLALSPQGVQPNSLISNEASPTDHSVPSSNKSLATSNNRKRPFRAPKLTTTTPCLSLGELELPWIDETSDTLIISQKSVRQHWATVPLNRIANVALLIALLEQLLPPHLNESD